ncbi:hypothetical protein [Caudoviricetes sp.]|nr:hypothetical protein [Caudoviricetes sp.]
MWFDQAAASQSQGIQGAMLQQAIQAGRAEDAINRAKAESAAAIKEAQTQGIGALKEGQTGALGGLEKYYGAGVGFQEPYMTTGAGATNRLAQLYGVGGDYTRMPTLEELQMDPGYAFRTKMGEQAMLNMARAGGTAGSGGALKASIRYGQEAGSQEYQNAYNRFMANRLAATQGLENIAGRGLTAAGTATGLAGTTGANVGNVYTGTAANAANLYGQTGTNLANVYTGAGRDIAANYNALGQNIGQGLVNQGAANASSYTNTANLLGALAGQGLQAGAMFAGGGGLKNAAFGLFGSPFPRSYSTSM